MLQLRTVPATEFITPSGRVPELRDLLATPRVQELFDLLVDSCKSGEAQVHRAHDLFREGKEGQLALQAALLFGGLPQNAAYDALHQITLESERHPTQAQIAEKILRVSLHNRAIYPGSFDPMTIGHRDLLFRSAAKFDEVLLAVGINSEKNPLFSIEERIAMLKEQIKGCPGRVRVVSYIGLVAHYAELENCHTIIRGIRGVTDNDMEAQLADLNRNQATRTFQLDTHWVPANHEFVNVASSKVREIAKHGGEIDAMVKAPIARAVQEKFAIRFITDAWNELGLFPGDKAASEAALKDILERYTRPERHYHNAVHIFKMLKVIDQYRKLVRDRKAMIAGVLFHDYDYDPDRKDNEERSAVSAKAILDRGGMPPFQVEAACRHILLTKRHEAEGESYDSKLFVDADRLILAANPAEYDRYRLAIREEYRVCYNDAEFAEGRKKFLKHVADRAAIFATDEFRARFGPQARDNIKAERREFAANAAYAEQGL